jgi:hypothetical protein
MGRRRYQFAGYSTITALAGKVLTRYIARVSPVRITEGNDSVMALGRPGPRKLESPVGEQVAKRGAARRRYRFAGYSTVTDLARLRGWSTLHPRATAT